MRVLLLRLGKGPSKDKTLWVHTYSATEISAFRSCERSWGFKYIDGIRPPPKASQAFGTKVHALLESYLRDGTPLPLSAVDPEERRAAQIAAAGVHLLPTGGVEVEGEFRFTSFASGYVYLGFTDFARLSPGVRGLIGDHKTTSDFRYQKTEEDLLTDPQALLYAKRATLVTGVNEAEIHWIYYRTKGSPLARETRFVMPADRIAEGFQGIENTVSEIETRRKLVAKGQVNTLKPSFDRCNDFGGCPYQDRCDRNPTQALGSFMSKLDLSRFTGKPAATPAPATPPPQQEVPPARPPQQMDLDAPFRPKGFWIEEPKVTKDIEKRAFNPNDPEYWSKEFVAFRVTNWKKLEANDPTAVQVTDVPSINPPEYQPPPAAETREGAGQEATMPAPEPTLASPASNEGFILCVNCTPVADLATLAEDYINEAKEILLAEGVADYRFVDYAKGAGMLVVALGKVLTDNPPTAEFVVIDAGTPEGAVCLSTFQTKAYAVIRGF